MRPKILPFLLMLILFVTFLLPSVLIPSVKSSPDPGWLSGWSYRKSHVIDSASGAGTGYQIKIKTYWAGVEADSGGTVSLTKPGEIKSIHAGRNSWDSQGRHFVAVFPNKLYWSTDGGSSYSLRYTFQNNPIDIRTCFVDAQDRVFVSTNYEHEAYSDFTEYDPNGHLTKSSISVAVSGLTRDEKVWLYVDKGEGHFSGDFKHILNVRTGSVSGADAQAIVWALWNSVGTMQDTSTGNGLVLRMRRATSDSTIYIGLLERYNGSWYGDDSIALNVGTWYYLVIERSGSTLTCKVYNNFWRTSLVDTLTVSLHSVESFRYLYGCQSRDDGATGTSFSGYWSNLALTDEYDVGRLYRSTDNGASFTKVMGNAIWGIDEDSSGNLYAGEYSGFPQECKVWKSTDGGASWSDISDSTWVYQYHVHNVRVDPSTGWLYAALGDVVGYRGIWRSKLKDGTDWVRKTANDYQYIGIAFKDGYIYIGDDHGEGKIKRFKDDGTSNEQIPITVLDDDQQHNVYYLEKDRSGRLWAAMPPTDGVSGPSKGRIYVSDDGTTWRKILEIDGMSYSDWLSKWTFRDGTQVFKNGDNDNLLTYTNYNGIRIYPSKAKADFSDVRFTGDDGTTLLQYWIQEKVDGHYAIFWIKVADDLSSQNQTIYIYYGKSDATTASNFDNTFPKFTADHETGDLSEWDETVGTVSATTDHPHTDTYGLKEVGGSPGPEVRHLLSGPTTGYSYCAFYYDDGTTTANLLAMLTLYEITGDDYCMVGYYTGQSTTHYSVRWYDGTWHDEVTSVTRITGWHLLEARATSTGIDLAIDGAVVKTLTFLDEAGLDKFMLSGSSGGVGWFDDAFIRKFVSPEPSHGRWGSEETRGSGGVGGIWIPVDKAPYITLTLTMILAIAITVVFFKFRKRK